MSLEIAKSDLDKVEITIEQIWEKYNDLGRPGEISEKLLADILDELIRRRLACKLNGEKNE